MIHGNDSESPQHAARLLRDIEQAMDVLSQISEERSAVPPAPGKWSPREVIGHLIDSASNNHVRFVRAALEEDMIFPGYEQDGWVSVQRYGEASWRDLLDLWAAFNRHLARTMAGIPINPRRRQRDRHNLDRIAFKAVPAGTPATLDYFMDDYVDHLEHHLRQVLGSWPPKMS